MLDKTPLQQSAVQSALRTIDIEARGIAALGQAAQNGLGAAVAEAVAIISAARGRVIVTGMGKSGHVGRKIAATLASTGTPAYFVHPGEASHGDLGMIQQDDVIIALSWSGEARELVDIVEYSRRFRVALIALTSNPQSALGRRADVCLTLPIVQEACPNGVAPTTSTTMQMVMGDALAIALLEGRGFTRDDFRLYHPGGKLGAQLRLVRDIMNGPDRMPVVRVGAAMGDAVASMSRGGFGCVVVIDAAGCLAGIVTDGDLRRHLGDDLALMSVDHVMTRAPRTISPERLAAEALEQVETARITALVVVDDERRPVGLVHVHDLLRLGVA
jgi:arabinose-5-phosphate isomerase